MNRQLSEAQLAANRANAQKSTGPRTEEGKAASSQNAVKHGLYAYTDVLEGETREAFLELRDDYHQRLAAGGKAGRYAPSPLQPEPDAEAARTRILAQHAEAVAALTRACARWPDAKLDRCQLPHPLLGPLTVREMLFFTVYHNQHHVAVVRRRVAGLAAAPSAG